MAFQQAALAMLVLLLLITVEAWTTQIGYNRGTQLRVSAVKGHGSKDGGGYKFGDFTRSLGRRITGDENYQVSLLFLVFDIICSAARSSTRASRNLFELNDEHGKVW